MYAKGYVTRTQISIGGEQCREIPSHLNTLIEHLAATNYLHIYTYNAGACLFKRPDSVTCALCMAILNSSTLCTTENTLKFLHQKFSKMQQFLCSVKRSIMRLS